MRQEKSIIYSLKELHEIGYKDIPLSKLIVWHFAHNKKFSANDWQIIEKSEFYSWADKLSWANYL